MDTTPTQALVEQARRVLPGGSFGNLPAEMIIREGKAGRVWDEEGREYVDFLLGSGPMFIGHGHPEVTAAVQAQVPQGTTFFANNRHGIQLAEEIVAAMACAEQVRFVCTGTEADLYAMRVARAFRKRDKILKFEGHFHGYADALNFSAAPPLDQAGPAAAPRAYPESAGIPASSRGDILIIPFNDEGALEQAFARHGGELATLMLEPINYDQGCIEPQPGFLQRCRELCDRHGVILCFDEVLTAFRMAPGGAQQYLGVTPDLCVLGKAFGGGTPISAVAGRREIMQHLRPVGRSEMSGTYLAHLTTVLGALAALEEYSRPGFYERLQAVGAKFYAGFQDLIDRSGVPVRLQHVGPRFGMYFGIRDPVTNYRQAALKNRALEHAFLAACFRRGVYFAVSPHHGFSAAHTDADLARVLAAAAEALEEVKSERASSQHPSRVS